VVRSDSPIAQRVTWAGYVLLGFLTGYAAFEAAGTGPTLWPLIFVLCIGLGVGAIWSRRARPYFVTAATLCSLALSYVVMLWVVLGGFG